LIWSHKVKKSNTSTRARRRFSKKKIDTLQKKKNTTKEEKRAPETLMLAALQELKDVSRKVTELEMFIDTGGTHAVIPEEILEMNVIKTDVSF